jgi:hypothetical protein
VIASPYGLTRIIHDGSSRAALGMLNVESSESVETGCARASDEFRTFNILQINPVIVAEVFMNNAG